MWITRRFRLLERVSARGAGSGASPVLVLSLVSALLSLLVVGPLVGRGFVLVYDMVFAPRQFLVPDSVGLGSALPRSVPADAVVAGLTSVVPGDIVQQLILFGALFAGPLGAGLFVPATGTAVRVVAAVGYGWSAYVAERLFIGHWPYLLAYAALPWVALAARRLRERAPRSAAGVVVACAPAVLTPSGGILVAVMAMVVAGPRRLPTTVTIALVLNAPWWVPSVLHPGGGLSTSDGVGAFAARAEAWAGPVVSLLGLGGIWNGEVTPESRANPIVPVLVVATVVIAFIGLWKRRELLGITVLGAAGVLLAAVGSLPGGDVALGWVVENVPGGGLLRDSQKWVAWWALPLAIGFALGVRKAMDAVRGRQAAIVAAAIVFPVAMLPDLAFAGWGRLDTVDYPADWTRVSEVLRHDDRPGHVVTLPFGAFRRFAWNDHRTQLDPAPRVLPRTTVIDDTLVVDGVPVAGEDNRAAAVRRGDLRGIGWILVEHGTPGEVDDRLLRRTDQVHAGEWLSLYRVRGEILPAQGGPPRTPVLTADMVALAMILLSVLWLALPTGRLTTLDRRRRE